MKTITYIFVIIVIHLIDNTGSLSMDNKHSYTVKGVKYTVEEVFSENCISLTQRFMNLIVSADNVLTEQETRCKINTKYVSAVGKDKNEKDSK